MILFWKGAHLSELEVLWLQGGIQNNHWRQFWVTVDDAQCAYLIRIS